MAAFPDSLPVIQRDCVASTNDEVKRLLASTDVQACAVRARRQSAGRGRRGHRWESPEGGLYLSIGWRVDDARAPLPPLSLVVALAVRAAIVKMAPALASHLRVKWPNDLLVRDEQRSPAKLCGISLEAVGHAVCIGIGVNGYRPPAEAPLADIPYPLAYGSDFGLFDDFPESGRQEALEALARRILAACAPMFNQWLRHGFAPFQQDFEEHSALQGRRVRAIDGAGKAIEADVRGVDVDGRLLLQTSHGLTRFTSGEVSLRL